MDKIKKSLKNDCPVYGYDCVQDRCKYLQSCLYYKKYYISKEDMWSYFESIIKSIDTDCNADFEKLLLEKIKQEKT